MTGDATERCSGCGLAVPGGTPGCLAIRDELLARDFGSALYFRAHRLLVDTYCLQHPDTHCVSAKSLAAHLMGLCWWVEHGGGKAVGSESLRRWLDGTPRIEKPEIPAYRGRLTIAEVREARDPMAHDQAVESWAMSTWEAYASLHSVARQWIEQALSGKRPPRR